MPSAFSPPPGDNITAERLDSYQRDIAKGLSKAFDHEATEEHELDLDTAKLVVFSDHHKGARDGADDFQRCERAYMAALGYYLEEGHRLYVLGDVEELWENSPDEPLNAYAKVLELEAEFHRQGRYERFWGNHDDYWGHPARVERRLQHYYPQLKVREALKLRITSGGETIGLLFLIHGHQGTAESQRFAWFSKLVVRYIWRPLQRRFGFSATTPATNWELRARHNQALFSWARSHPAKPVLIAGHTHKPVFGTSTPPKAEHRPLAEVQADLDGARAKSPTDVDKIARLRAELGWIEAIERSAEPAPIPIEPPCYFNTGCCSFPDGDVTGIEIADGMVRLVRWPDDEGRALPKILVEDDLRKILSVLGAPD
jgi:UDP-2,3-diacylglucosamine pyrophosphatase LpxH